MFPEVDTHRNVVLCRPKKEKHYSCESKENDASDQVAQDSCRDTGRQKEQPEVFRSRRGCRPLLLRTGRHWSIPDAPIRGSRGTSRKRHRALVCSRSGASIPECDLPC